MPDDIRRVFNIEQYKVFKLTFQVTASSAGNAVAKLLADNGEDPDIAAINGSLTFVETDETRGDDFDDFLTDDDLDVIADSVRFNDFIPSIRNVTEVTPPTSTEA